MAANFSPSQNAATLAAIISASPIVKPIAPAKLIDVAMSFVLARDVSKEEELSLNELATLVKVSNDLAFAKSDIFSVPQDSAEYESVVATSVHEEEAASQWLTGELLERVFG